MKTETPRHYPLPHKDNIASHDVMRIREALEKIDADVTKQERNEVETEALLKKHLFETQLALWRSPYESE